VNNWADFWRYKIGVNVIPADTRKKVTYEKWSEWQDKPIPEELHNQWKTENKYSDGIAIVLGKVWHNKQKLDLYLNGIDADNSKAIDEICSRDGEGSISLKQLANWTLVEQHQDDTNKAHIYVYSYKPFAKKSSDRFVVGNNGDDCNISAIEVKGEGQHGILFCCPSIHKNGYSYQILGTQEPVIADDFELHIDDICRKYGIIYLTDNNCNGGGKSSSHLVPIEDLFKPDTKIYEGHNRHEALLRTMESLISRNKAILPLENIKQLATQWNSDHCTPPLHNKGFERQWECALEFVANKNCSGSSNAHASNASTKEQDQRQSKPKEFTVFKYSKDIHLAEEINLANRNVFLQIINGTPLISEKLNLSEQNDIILKPHSQGTGSPIFPYTFANVDEISFFVDRARKETIDSLFLKHKSIWKKIVVADNEVINLLAIDSLYSYFQDKFSTTHYDMFVGTPNSGKDAILLGFKYLGYRVVVASDMSGANLLDLLSSIEPNQITLAEDELDDIHENPDKLRIYKVGYDNTDVVPRTLDGNTSNRNARFYYPFCFKIYAAEESPDVKKLEGFNDRTFKVNTMKGKPLIYVKKLSEKTDSKIYNDIASKIDYLRKVTLTYRLIHHDDIIEQVNTNIEGRALELTEPQLRLFNSDKLASKERTVLQNDVLPVLSACLRSKGEIASKTLEAIVYQALNKLLPTACRRALLDTVMDTDNANNVNDALKVLSNQQIYEVRALADGSPIADKQHVFYSVEYGQVSEKKILKICRDKFHAKDTRNTRERSLEFNQDIVSKVGKTFDIVLQIEILKPEAEEDQDYEHDEDSEVWFGWHGDIYNNSDDNDDGKNKAKDNVSHTGDDTEESTSESMTERRKIGYIEDKEPVSDNTQQAQDRSQGDTSDDSVNSMELDYTIVHNSHKNAVEDQNIRGSEPSSKTRDRQSNEQQIDQKNSLINGNNTISVIPSLNDNKKVIDEGYSCYYCDSFTTNSKDDYESHVIREHGLKHPCYPSKPDLEKLELKAQGKTWET
jgi:hypothetical protein